MSNDFRNDFDKGADAAKNGEQVPVDASEDFKSGYNSVAEHDRIGSEYEQHPSKDYPAGAYPVAAQEDSEAKAQEQVKSQQEPLADPKPQVESPAHGAPLSANFLQTVISPAEFGEVGKDGRRPFTITVHGIAQPGDSRSDAAIVQAAIADLALAAKNTVF